MRTKYYDYEDRLIAVALGVALLVLILLHAELCYQVGYRDGRKANAANKTRKETETEIPAGIRPEERGERVLREGKQEPEIQADGCAEEGLDWGWLP